MISQFLRNKFSISGRVGHGNDNENTIKNLQTLYIGVDVVDVLVNEYPNNLESIPDLKHKNKINKAIVDPMPNPIPNSIYGP